MIRGRFYARQRFTLSPISTASWHRRDVWRHHLCIADYQVRVMTSDVRMVSTAGAEGWQGGRDTVNHGGDLGAVGRCGNELWCL